MSHMWPIYHQREPQIELVSSLFIQRANSAGDDDVNLKGWGATSECCQSDMFSGSQAFPPQIFGPFVFSVAFLKWEESFPPWLRHLAGCPHWVSCVTLTCFWKTPAKVSASVPVALSCEAHHYKGIPVNLQVFLTKEQYTSFSVDGRCYFSAPGCSNVCCFSSCLQLVTEIQ